MFAVIVIEGKRSRVRMDQRVSGTRVLVVVFQQIGETLDCEKSTLRGGFVWVFIPFDGSLPLWSLGAARDRVNAEA